MINRGVGYNGFIDRYINTSQSSHILINDTYFSKLPFEEKMMF